MSNPAPAPGDLNIIEGVSEIAGLYDFFILDIFGVIHNGLEPFPGTIECLQKLKDAGKKTCLLSNSPNRAGDAATFMESMGIARDLYDHIVTSGETTHRTLGNLPPDWGKDCWFIGTEKIARVFEGYDINILSGPEKARFIVNSIPGIQSIDHKELEKQLKVAAEKSLPMICSNPDLVVNIGDRQFPCAGTFAKLYEDIGGRVTYFGKPYRPIYEECCALLSNPPKNKIIAVGDSFHTDIAGANNFGIDSVFNLAGIHGEETGGTDLDPRKLQSLLQNQSHRPTYIMRGFNW